MDTTSDPRPLFFSTIEQTGRLVAGVRADQLTLPTPCAEYDVRTLLRHLVMVLRRVAHVATGGQALDIQSVTDVPDDEWAAGYEAGRTEVERLWADDAVLDRLMTLPFGQMPGRAAAAYTVEVTTHGWDLAAATGQESLLAPPLGAAALGIARQFIPAEPRGDRVPFGPVVEVSAERGPYARLAGWLGRTP